MHLRVLGCFGGSALGMRPTSFLINGKIAIDAGAITSVLSLPEQAEIGHIFFSHSHIDHLATLPFLLDNIFSTIQTPIILYGPQQTIDCMREHLFNNQLWPDFTTFSNENSYILTMKVISPDETMRIDNLKITPSPMVHTVPCYGYLVEEECASVFICGDTQSIDDALHLLEKASNLEAVILEASFPSRMKNIADLSRHLTPRDFAREVNKLPKNVRVLATHMKPECLGEIQQEIMDLNLENVSLIKQGVTYELGPARTEGGIRP